MKVGNVDTHWNVRRQKGQFQITEINSSKKSFLVEDQTVSGPAKKPFEYDPEQRPGTGTVDPGKELSTHQKQAPKGSAASIGMAAHQIRTGSTAQKFGQQGEQPPPLPPRQQQVSKKLDRLSAGKNHFDPGVVKLASQKLSDQEFGEYYGFSKQSALKRGSTPPPNPARVAKAGMKQYPQRTSSAAKTRTLTTGRKIPGKIIKEASPAFAKISAAFMLYMSNQADHVAQSNFINTISREKVGLVNKQEKDAVAAIEGEHLGQATKSADSSTRQSPLNPTQAQKSLKAPVVNRPGQLNQGIERKYRVTLREADGEVKGFQQPEEQPQTNSPEVPEQPPVEPQETSEEQAVAKLNGQTIKNANFESDENGNRLSLELAGSHLPTTLEWNKTGRVIFSFRGQKFVLKK